MDSVADELLSNYVLFSCEGTAEAVVINRLFEEGRLVVPRGRVVKDPITFKPLTRLRKAAAIEERFFTQNYAVEGSRGLLIARIIDSGSPQFTLSRMNRDSALVRNFITAREIEMLVIHAEGAYDDWLRKSRLNRQLMPSDYCIQHLGLHDVKSEVFLQGYWSDVGKLVNAVRVHASKQGKRKSNEFLLVDLLK